MCACANSCLNGNNNKDSKQPQIIKVGSSLDLSKGLRTVGEGFKDSISYVVKKENESNRNYTIDLTILDDEYRPNLTLQNVKMLFNEKKVELLLGLSGTPTLERALEFIKKNNMLVLFPTSASLIFRKPEVTNVINLIASDFDIGYAITTYLMDNESEGDLLSKIALFYQDDTFGRDRIKGAYKVIDERGLDKKNIIAASYERNDLNFPESVKKIKEKNVDAIVFFSTDLAAKSFIRQYGINEIREKKLLGTNELGSEDFKQFAKANDLTFVTAHEYPNPRDKNLSIAKLFQKDVAEGNGSLKLDNHYFGGYIVAKLFVDVLNKIDKKITKKLIIAQLEKMDNYNFLGLTLTFDKKTRQLLNSVWLDTGKEKWIEVKVGSSTGKPQKAEAKKIQQEGFF